MSTDQLNRVTHSPNSSIEHCPICLEDFKDQQIGIPEHCKHKFCFSCLVNWTKEENSCPNDREKFQYIFKKHSFSSRRPYAKVDIKNIESEIYLEEVISCDACYRVEQEYDPLLTCTRCKDRYHKSCLNSFNISTWMCPSCGYKHKESAKSVDNALMIIRARKHIKNFGLRDQGRTSRIAKPLRRLQRITPQDSARRLENLIIGKSPLSRNNPSVRSVITPTEAVRRIAMSGKPILPCPQSMALISQSQNMAALQLKRKLFARLPPKIPVNQLPRIQRRTDAPSRPRSKTITQRSNPSESASFIDKLLHSQKQLYSSGNIQIQGAHIKLS